MTLVFFEARGDQADEFVGGNSDTFAKFCALRHGEGTHRFDSVCDNGYFARIDTRFGEILNRRLRDRDYCRCKRIVYKSVYLLSRERGEPARHIKCAVPGVYTSLYSAKIRGKLSRKG